MEKSDQSDGVQLKREMGLWKGVSVVVSSMIGSGIFITPGTVLKTSGSAPLSIIIWALCGVLVMFGSFTYIELGSMMPKAGGDYEYLWQTFGSLAAFLFAWSRIVLAAPSSLAAGALAFGNYLLLPIFPCGTFPEAPRYLLALLALMIFTYLNCRSVKAATKLQLIFATGKALALCGVIVAGIYAFAIGGGKYYESGFEGTSTDPLDIIISFYSAIFAYTGWNFLNFVIEELKEPEKNLTRAVLIGVGMVTVFYVAANISYFAMIPREVAINSQAIAVTALGELYSPLGTVIAVLVSLSVFGYLNTALFTLTRVGFSAARNYHMPVAMAYVTVNFATPLVSVCVLSLFTVIYISIGNLESIIYMNSFCETFFYLVTTLAFFWLRWKKPDAPRVYKTFIGFPIIFFFGMLFITIMSLIREPEACFGGLALILGGSIFYFVFCYMVKPPTLQDVIDKIMIAIQKVSYSTVQLN
ncbi:hypothetical protein GJ496_003524 [Pomphorhynchus laevis]|nr:hypothetical protein GJ496_003524 [Pomphorhynchus laevis]